MSKMIFHEFSPEIYPRKLWICINPVENILDEQFRIDNKYGSGDFKFDKEYSLATTSPVFKRESGDRGILICFRNKSSLNFDIVAHEACHAADYICEELGIIGQSFSENNEHYTYLVGWIAKCCEQTKNYHNKH